MRLLSILFVLFFGLQAAAQERLALVIGNSNYAASGYLKQPVNDAQIMADALKDIGFKVTLRTDLDDGDLKRAIRDHRDALYDAGDNAISFFYYAGHGANDSEDDYGGTNYMIPIGAKMDTVRDLSIEAVELSDAIKSFSRAGISFVVFDACRNFPFSSSLTRSSVRGFTVQPETKGTFIAFSSEPGRTALDDSGFSLALADALKTPGLDHRDVFTSVRTKVYQQTSQKQFSWFRDGILGDVIFKKGAAPKPVIRTKTDDEIAWEFTSRINSKAAYKIYLETFPNGKFVQVAQDKIKSTTPNPEPDIIPVWSKITDEYWSTLSTHKLLKFVVAEGGLDAMIKAADEGNPDAALAYADYLTSFDYNKELDFDLAFKYNEIAHEGGKIHGTHRLGYYYSKRLGDPASKEKSKEFYELACKGGYDLSCNNLAFALQREKEFGRANELYQRACNLGAATACANLALQYAKGNPELAKDFNKAFELADQACLSADEYACFALGDLYRNGWGVEKSPLLAEVYYLKACKEHNPVACRLLGIMKLNGEGIPKDTAKAFELLKKSCDLYDLDACLNLAYMYRNGIHVATDFAKAMEIYQDSCDKKNSYGCSQIGFMEKDGQGRAVNYSRARKYFAKACELKNATACNQLGYLNSKALGGPSNQAEAVRLYILSCDLKSAISCKNVGNRYLNGSGVPKDFRKALEFHTKACDLGNMHGCYQAGNNEFKGQTGSPNYTQAKRFYKSGCELKHAASCTQYGYLTEAALDGGKWDYTEALKYYIQGCDLKNAMGCSNASIIYEYGRDTPVSYSKAAHYIRRAVLLSYNRKFRDNMRRLAKKMKSDKQFSQDAKQLFELGCDKGDKLACAELN